MEERLVYINGKLVPRSEAKISVFDHGLLYGDGVFEGIRAYNGRVFKLDEHIDRLYASARAIMLEIPMSKEEMKKAIIETLRANKMRDAYIRVVVTRGEGDLGLDPRKCKNPNVIIIVDEIVLYETEGIRMITSTIRRVPPECLPPGVKSLNYLNNILAKIQANLYGAEEALMLDINGFVAEGTGDNIFIVKNGVIITPPPTNILRGITRDTVIKLARELGFEVVERNITLDEVYTADEVFLTGTAAEIAPVIEVDGRKIGDGKPGKITKQLMEKFRELTRTEGTPIYEE